MRIEVQNLSRYRTISRPGDDVPLVLPGAVFGVFDGATDPRGTVVNGIGAGRLAALTVAEATAALALQAGARDGSGPDILAHLSDRLARRTRPLDLPIPPSTTAAMALDCGDHWRFLAIGDTGIRLNGDAVLRHEKPIDGISTHARVQVFKALAQDGPATDETEAATRRAIFLGLDLAVREGVLTRARADGIIAATIRERGVEAQGDLVAAFLRGGIRIQHEFSNDPASPLGFDTLNGTLPRRGEWLDFTRPKAAVRSIEIFSDGYPDIPSEVSVAAWEAAFHGAEAEDVHKIGRFATVKGSTAAEFFDDRTVIVIDRL